MLRNGLYEQVINKALEGELATTDKLVETAPIDGGESSKVLSKYIAEIIEKGLDIENADFDLSFYLVGLLAAVIFMSIYNKVKVRCRKVPFALIPFLAGSVIAAFFI